MEGKGAERHRSKPEADINFNPLSATAAEWEAYLLNGKNFEKDFTQGEYPFKSPALSILEKVKEAGAPRSVIETAVAAILEKWDEIVGQETFLKEITPIGFVASLANEDSVDVVQKLWTNAPKDSAFLAEGLRQAARGLGEHIPIDQKELERLYVEDFKQYQFTALEIMLKRGEKERATALFEAHADQYGKGFDPGVFDRLVRLGLPASSAKKWLDQSNNKPGGDFKYHYDDALKRWGYTPEQ